MTIGQPKQRHGLYMLQEMKGPDVDNATSHIKLAQSVSADHSLTSIRNEHKTLDHFNLWHFRLGHTPIDKARILQKSYFSIHVLLDNVCTICHETKQKCTSDYKSF